ncbi:MAG TPA: hypothetical protein VF142_21615 [Longimicrobium sp.]
MTNDQSEVVARWGEGVRVGPPLLHALSFQYDGSVGGELPQPIKVQFEIGVVRLAELALGVEFTSRVIEIPELTASATYRVEFVLEPGSPEAEQPERALRLLACRIAPVTLYPFCREALTSTAQRAGLTRFVTPITNVGALWEEDEIQIPPVDDDCEGDPDRLPNELG